MPEVRCRAESFPFAVVGGRDGVADVAAKRFAVRVVRRTFFPAVEFCDWSVEVIVQRANVGRVEIGGGAEDTGHA